MLSVHTSPLEQPGTADAGGMNVYVVETARRLAQRGVAVEIFTRATDGSQAEMVQLAPGVLVHHIPAGPFEGLSKDDLPGQLCAFAAGMMRTAMARPERWYDLVHSHYWLSGQVGWLAADRWNVPLVHTMHTMARVKNAELAAGDRAEPMGREIGEAQVVQASSTLVANTEVEARQLIDLYAADHGRVHVVNPGVDLDVFSVGSQSEARRELDLGEDDVVLLFVGRLQPLKAPDVLVRAAAELLEMRPELRERLVVAILGGPSGSGLEHPESLLELANELGLSDNMRFQPPVSRAELASWYRSADLVAVPSHSESFGLVAVEALASGAPVVAARVGGLPIAVGDAGVLVDGHDPAEWAGAFADLLDDPQRLADLRTRAPKHAQKFGWDRSVDELLSVYRLACAERSKTPINGSASLSDIPTAVVP